MPYVPIDYSIKRKVEQAFADAFNNASFDARCYTSKSDEQDIPMPYLVAIAKNAKQIGPPNSNAYEVDFRLVLVSSPDWARSDDHEQMVAGVKDFLDLLPRPWDVPELGVYINGFMVTDVTSSGSDDDETFGDVWGIKAGAQG